MDFLAVRLAVFQEMDAAFIDMLLHVMSENFQPVRAQLRPVKGQVMQIKVGSVSVPNASTKPKTG